ncbi:MAG: hypothetical protein J3K34DRAFT_466880 [Monoraphidium minutum]|nr:MAG: hypothetical protein J3K34DRAFT_466880 [Monoraphidium minutum]
MLPAPSAPRAAASEGVSHPALLALIFERLPPVEQFTTVGRFAREWRRWAVPKAAALQARRSWRDSGLYQLPSWLFQEAWASRLKPRERSSLLMRAAWHGDVAALAWAPGRADDAAPWSAVVCQAAAEGGRLEALRWLR